MQVGSFEFVFGLKHNLTARAFKQGAVCLALARDAFKEIAKMHPDDMSKVFRNGMTEHKVKGAATMKSRASSNSRNSKGSGGSKRSNASKKSNASRASKGSKSSKSSKSSKRSNRSNRSRNARGKIEGTKDTNGKDESNEVRGLAAVFRPIYVEFVFIPGGYLQIHTF
jgi:hypothetical protein